MGLAIHFLRRGFAQRRQDPRWIATPFDGDPTEDPALDDELFVRMDSHLCCHSDAEGFYLPIDFKDVLYGSDDTPIAGGMLGSTQRLREELIFVAPALGIRLDAGGALSDAEAARIDAVAGDDGALCRELCVWLALHEAARLSLAQRCAIVFA